jgi:hypothetical protein
METRSPDASYQAISPSLFSDISDWGASKWVDLKRMKTDLRVREVYENEGCVSR